MFSLKSVKDDSIIICDNETKEEIVKEMRLFPQLRIKFISKKELKNALYFTYDDEAVVYLIKKGYAYINAKEIMENLSGIEKGSNKLNSLYGIYEELSSKNLLKKDSLFGYLFRGKNVYIAGYSSQDTELKYLLDQLHIKYDFMEKSQEKYKPLIHEFEDMDTEVRNFFSEVCKLKNNGVSLNDIYLYSYPSEYDWIMKKYARIYNMPIEFKWDMKLYEVELFKKYILLLDEYDFEEALEKLGTISYEDYSAYQKLVGVVNDSMNLKEEKEFKIRYIKEKAKETKLKSRKYSEAVRIVSSSFNKDGYVFMVGFSLGDYPSISRDTDLLSDKEKKICHKNTSIIKNKIAYEKLSDFVTSYKNLYISRKKKEGKEEKYDSEITKNLHLEKVQELGNDIRYNYELTSLEVASSLDDKKNYGIKDELCDALGENGKDFRYNQFDHHFQHSSLFKNEKELTLSYSQVNEYYNCPYKYFIKRLCVKEAFEDTFNTKFGTLCHEILEDSLNEDIDLNGEKVQKRLHELFSDSKEAFFAEILLPQMDKVIAKNKLFMNVSKFSKAYGEKKHIIKIDGRTSLTGTIDKVLINEEDKEIIVVDYKSGNFSFDRRKVPYGLNLQLPSYGLLLKNLYPDYKQVGAYIQNICIQDNSDIDTSYLLGGVTLNNTEYIRHIDPGLDGKSIFVDGVKQNKNGTFRENNSLIEEEDYQLMIKEADKAIHDAMEKIRNGEFDINPSMVNDSPEACNGCPAKYICFHDANDYRRITLKKEEKKEEN